MTNRKTFAALALVLVAATAVPAFASERARAQVQPKLTVAEVDAKARELGYTTIRGIELKRSGIYEVKALDANGGRVELRVDGATGAVVAAQDDRGRRHDGDRSRDRR